jgi:hypothetical protein
MAANMKTKTKFTLRSQKILKFDMILKFFIDKSGGDVYLEVYDQSICIGRGVY